MKRNLFRFALIAALATMVASVGCAQESTVELKALISNVSGTFLTTEDSGGVAVEDSSVPEVTTPEPESLPEVTTPEESSAQSSLSLPSLVSKPAQTSKPTQTSQSSQTSKPAQTSKASQTSKPAQTSQASQTSKPAQTSQASQTSKPAQTSKTETSQQKITSFSNPDNISKEDNTITISPTAVYYKDGKLVAETRIYNGFSDKASKIAVKSFTLSNSSGVVAEISVSELKKDNGTTLSIPSKGSITYTFVFQGSNLKQKNADFSVLYWHSSTTYTLQQQVITSYSNPDNISKKDNAITISPTAVYYKDGKLVAETRIYNGFSDKASEIAVKSFTLSNNSGVVAEISVSELKKDNGTTLSIPSKGSTTYTFVFQGSNLKQKNADFSALYWHSSTSYTLS